MAGPRAAGEDELHQSASTCVLVQPYRCVQFCDCAVNGFLKMDGRYSTAVFFPKKCQSF